MAVSLPMPRSSTAVLLFTRSAGEEAVHKRFLSQGKRASNATVAAQLIAHATVTAQRVAVDFVCVDSTQQTGATFGERLTGAVQSVFGQGYTHLLVIGNDCPQLDERLLQRAVAAVQSTGAVLGPATDGGVYLLGISRELFEKSQWLTLPWQTRQLGAALLQQLRHQGATVGRLPPLADVDDEQELAQALRLPLARTLLRRLRQLRATKNRALRPTEPRICRLAGLTARPRRGPPTR
ncbi:MAG: hypothetical protein JWP58_4292 [Hymenobacter sp.]|nr:hypothetical protein [Hymenobacter sp.]